MLKKGDTLSFTATKLDFSDLKLAEIASQYKIISSVPSLDTSVCFVQTDKFNQKIKDLNNATLITISYDLPFAANRICKKINVPSAPDQHFVVSDYKYGSFAQATELFDQDRHLLRRALIITDQWDKVIYLQVTDKLSDPLDYQDVYQFLHKHVKYQPKSHKN